MTTKQYLTIESGPSREELIDAFKYANDKEHPFEVKFSGMVVLKGEDRHQELGRRHFSARVIGLKHEDGSGSSFIVEAYLSFNSNSKLTTFYYSAKRRSGHIDLF